MERTGLLACRGWAEGLLKDGSSKASVTQTGALASADQKGLPLDG